MPKTQTDKNPQLVEKGQPSTKKWKQLIAQIKQISKTQIDNESQLVENNYISTNKWKQSLAKIVRISRVTNSLPMKVISFHFLTMKDVFLDSMKKTLLDLCK